MSRSFIAIALCVSFLGMTVVPARFMPCCCKGARSAAGTEAVPAVCCPAAVTTDGTAEIRGSHTSCHAIQKRTPVAACCTHAQAIPFMVAGNVIAAPCHDCRCIKQMQIVALPGFAVSEKAYRLTEMAVAVAEMPTITPAERWAESLSERGYPGIVITLQTCSFRC